jgi:ketosteroid isomerase-like protein
MSETGRATARTDEEVIRELDREWSQAAENKDVAKCATFYSETGAALPFNAPLVSGRANLREFLSGLMSKPGFALRFAPTRIEVAQSRELAYDIGTFELKLNDENGQSMTIPGKYLVVWKKQADGQWKAEADIFNTDK